VQLDHVMDGAAIERDARLGREDARETRLNIASDDAENPGIEDLFILV